MKLAVTATVLCLEISGIFAQQPLKYAYKSTFVQNNQKEELDRPHGLALDAQGNLYVASTLASHGMISVFAPDNTYLRSFSTYADGNGSNPIDLDFDSQENLYVTDHYGGRVLVFDKSGIYIKTFASGMGGITGLDIDNNDNVYVVNGGNVLIYNAAGTLIRTFSSWVDENTNTQSFSKNYDVLVDNANQRIYVSDMDSRVIVVFDLNGNYSKTISQWNNGGTLTNFDGPRGMCFDNSGNLLITDHNGNRGNRSNGKIIGINFVGNTVLSFQTSDPMPFVICKSNGNILTSNGQIQHINEFSSTGSVLGLFNISGGQPSFYGGSDNPHAMAYDAQGNLYVSALLGDAIFVFAPDGTILRSFFVKDGSPNGLAFDAQENLYVASINRGTVSVYNKNGTFIKTFVSGLKGPRQIAIDAANKVYIANIDNSEVLVYNATGTLIHTISSWIDESSNPQSFDHPYGIAVNNANIYVSDMRRGDIVVFDLNGNYVKTISDWNNGGTTESFTGNIRGLSFDNNGNLLISDMNHYFVALDAAGNTVYAIPISSNYYPYILCKSNGIILAASDDNEIVEFDPATGEKIAVFYREYTINDFGVPNTIVFDASDNAYISSANGNSGSNNNNRILKFSSNGEFERDFASPYGLQNPQGMAIDNRGFLWVGDLNNGRVQIINPTNNEFMIFAPDSTFNNPYGIVFDKQNNVYIASNMQVKVFSQSGTYIRAMGLTDSLGTLSMSKRIAIDNSGNLYITAWENNGTPNGRVIVINNAGTFIREIGGGQLVRPFDVKITPEGYVAVSDRDKYEVLFFDTVGNFITSIGYNGNGNLNHQFTGPRGINFDSKGNLYICDQENDRVQVWKPVHLTGFNGYVYTNKTTTVNVPSLFPAQPLHEDLMPYPADWMLKDSLQDTVVFNGTVNNANNNFSLTIPQVTAGIRYTLVINCLYAEYDTTTSSWHINPATDPSAGYLEVGATAVVGYTITASACANATILPSGTIDVAQGTNHTFTLTAASGYKLKTVLIDGTPNAQAATDRTYTFTNIQANHTIEISAVELTTNIAEAYGNESVLRIYPNPTSGQLIIASPNPSKGGEQPTIEIYNVVGQVVFTSQLSNLSPETTIDISHLSVGLYFLKVDGKMVKIVKE